MDFIVVIIFLHHIVVVHQILFSHFTVILKCLQVEAEFACITTVLHPNSCSS